MYVSASSSSRSSGTFKQVLSSPLYRGATIAMFLSGLGSQALSWAAVSDASRVILLKWIAWRPN